jgi:hypothetical protein
VGQNSEIWWKSAFWYYTFVEKMVKQVEIGKKDFFKPFKSRKNTVRRLWRLRRIWEEQARWF